MIIAWSRCSKRKQKEWMPAATNLFLKEGTVMLEKTNLLGAVTAIAFFVSAILVFVFRLLGKPQYGHWIGYFEFLLAVPLIYLLIQAPRLERPALYYIQIACMLAWLILEALLDYILKVDFRTTPHHRHVE